MSLHAGPDFPLTTVLAVFQGVGQDKWPHLGLVYSPPQCPAPGTGGHSLQSRHPMGRFHLVPPSPLFLEALSWGPMGASVRRQGLLAPCWLRGQGLAVGFLKYRGYCLFSISTPTTFVTVSWLEGVALSLGSQALAGDTQAPTGLALTSPCLLGSALCTGSACGHLVSVSQDLRSGPAGGLRCRLCPGWVYKL